MKKEAFSLVELLVVVAIIGILSVILVPNVQIQLEKAKVAKTKALIGNLEVSIEVYKNDFGHYPTSYNPQALYLALVEEAKNPIEPNSDDVRRFERGTSFWIQERNDRDDRRQNILQQAGVPSRDLTAQEEENAFVDAWENPLYFVSSEVYNPGGRTDFRRRGSTAVLDAAAAYEMRESTRLKPFNPTTFQLISFGPDQTTITPRTTNGGIGSMIDTDRQDNDEDEYFDKEDRVRGGDLMSNDPEVVAEDDITNF